MQLIVMRHGVAEVGEPGKDEERALTGAGKKRTQQVVRGLMTVVPKVNTILSSPLVRARQTAELVAEHFKARVEIDESLRPGGEATVVLSRRAAMTTVMVGHEPDLSELIGSLLGGERQSVVVLKKAGCVLLQVERADRAKLLWALTPKLLRRLGK